MLTDIFADRYEGVPLWQTFGEPERRLLVQTFRIVSEQLYQNWESDGKENQWAKAQWKSIHDRLSMELGLQQLSPLYYQTTNSLGAKSSAQWTMVYVCQNFMFAPINGSTSVDRHIKERLSLIEIAFRDKEEALSKANEGLAQSIARADALDKLIPPSLDAKRIPGSRADGLRAINEKANQAFHAAVVELNERLRRAGTSLNYHNGFIQISDDALMEALVETPFWDLVSDPKWKNVDTDMKEAIDLRDNGGRNPAVFAAHALESTIKIISDEKGWTRGGESGAAQYIDNLMSAKNGRFVEVWEGDALKKLFSSVRNELGHGPGSKPMPELTTQQTNWAIETCMAWIKSLIRRM